MESGQVLRGTQLKDTTTKKQEGHVREAKGTFVSRGTVMEIRFPHGISLLSQLHQLHALVTVHLT